MSQQDLHVQAAVERADHPAGSTTLAKLLLGSRLTAVSETKTWLPALQLIQSAHTITVRGDKTHF